MSTLTRALHSAPFPSPLGAENPPAGRYEGAVLGLASLGPHAIKTSLWGNGGSALSTVDQLVGTLYPGISASGKGLGKTGLMKATFRALSLLTHPKPSDAAIPSPDAGELAERFGDNVARALEKRPWMATELLRLYREGVPFEEEEEAMEEVAA